jgi:LAS superfamily LD-carboxypeptidase LdcB
MKRAFYMGLSSAILALSIAAAIEAQPQLHPMCGLCRPTRRGHFVARADVLPAPDAIDGDDLLALVNRTPTGALPQEYEPADLVDLETMQPTKAWRCTPPAHQCLRRDAAAAYARLRDAMREEHFSPYVYSAFRSYRVQCATFQRWTEHERGGFCEAVTASALPGHSQHQLGTSIDLFTYPWLDGGDRFREGYGCTPEGEWIATHAHEYGFVLPYPLHPDYRRDQSACRAQRGLEARIDPRTGYRYEPWHLRYLGLEHARAFHDAWQRSGPGTIREITLEQWLRSRRAERDPIGPPVCDGCNCGACATLAAGEEPSPCARTSMRLNENGEPIAADRPPSITSASLVREGELVILQATVDVPQGTWTQPPIVGPEARFRRGSGDVVLPDRASRPFAPIAGTWRLGIGPSEQGWPWQVALVSSNRNDVANGLNARIVGQPGTVELRISLEGVSAGTFIRVGLVSGENVTGERRLQAP